MLAVVLIGVVLTVAYGSAPVQLGIAEFTPSAQQNLETPPPTDQRSGRGAGGRGARRSTTTITAAASDVSPTESATAAPTTRVGRARRCYGNPPLTTEDPMSPPCVPTIFEGDNGGATYKGVSGTEIRVGIPGRVEDDGRPGFQTYISTIKALFDHFNSHFEFYGRRLVPVFVSESGGRGTDVVGGRAMAAELDARHVFAAATGFWEWDIGYSSLPAQLAREGILTFVRGATTWWSDRTLYDEYHPYVWSAFPSLEDMQRNLADFSCTALAGKPAIHAGDVPLRSQTRHFGIVSWGTSAPPPVNELAQRLAACEGREPSRVSLTSATLGADRLAAMNRLKSDGVTTMFCVCEGYTGETAYSYAGDPKQADFHPEWVFSQVTTQAGNDEGAVQRLRIGSIMAPPMRVNAGPRLLPTQARPWYSAVAEPLSVTTDPYREVAMSEFFYAPLLALASGVQAAGPDLNPETFATGLMNLQFPSPGAGKPPYWQPSVGFGPGDHSFFDDYHVGWWSDDADAMDLMAGTGILSTKGSWCYLDQAARYSVGKYPKDAEQRMFNSSIPCR